MSKRNKNLVLIGLAFAMLLVFSGCASKKTDEEKLADAIQEALKDSSKNENASKDPDTLESHLKEISHFLTSDIWNDGFVNISWFIGSGTNSTGDKMDIDFTIERLGKAMEKKAEYDTYIQGLDASNDGLKQVWTKLSNEIDVLYNKLKEKTPVAEDSSYEFDTGLFEQYRDAFKKDIEALTSN
ncbi:hypothetical protein [Paenibacillus radicis (ex Gao et al. 2016)]|uniref:Lipoprotein n=1 Tax=Paenibacillus radicis (ex Gao et al. 2016) TaxID=1737354 RepID=A0A917HGX5_9BACL|nr:hypothetical protein [Paenibacillus radicis (ex Gao et al. 2016)]GGG78836.1 hypothetical protein GCM10010918_39750 [Paenibacillus radicis (ex Gao et al. 2016)]